MTRRDAGVFGCRVWRQLCSVGVHTPTPAFGSARGVALAGNELPRPLRTVFGGTRTPGQRSRGAPLRLDSSQLGAGVRGVCLHAPVGNCVPRRLRRSPRAWCDADVAHARGSCTW